VRPHGRCRHRRERRRQRQRHREGGGGTGIKLQAVGSLYCSTVVYLGVGSCPTRRRRQRSACTPYPTCTGRASSIPRWCSPQCNSFRWSLLPYYQVTFVLLLQKTEEKIAQIAMQQTAGINDCIPLSADQYTMHTRKHTYTREWLHRNV